ncbi:MAG: DNA processing protein [Candidatus Midichloriaceae bacterium]|jgi:DNA processing protein
MFKRKSEQITLNLSPSSCEEFRFSWVRLARTKNVGCKTFLELLHIYGNPIDALANIEKLAFNGNGGNNKKLIPSKSSIEKEFADTEKFGAKLILSCDDDYPQILKQIPDHPPVLVAKGNTELLNKDKLAIVGARNSTINGNKLSYNFAKAISESGYIIVSGLAKGIDSFAHQGSVKTQTIGVIAGGIDHIYPKENEELFKALYESGLVITEYPIHTKVLPQFFPQRNRIIAGLSLGVLVIEASKKSGTLITSKFALDYNREVYAIPGSPLDNNAQGTNELLKQGANIALTPTDVLQDLNKTKDQKDIFVFDKKDTFSNYHSKKAPSEDDLKSYRDLLKNSLSHSPIFIDDIVAQLEIPINVLSCLLIELELAEKIVRLSGNKIQLISNNLN